MGRGDNVIKDPNLTDAFTQGFNEAVAARDVPTKYQVEITFGGVKIVDKIVDTPDEVIAIVTEHLPHGDGVQIEINVTQQEDAAPAEVEASDDDIVDAEVIEDQPAD